MRCRNFLFRLAVAVLPLIPAWTFWSCNEELPTYHFPEHVMTLSVPLAEQMSIRVAPPGYQKAHVVLVVKNDFDEVFYDSVRVAGSVRIWWKRLPNRYVTLDVGKENMTNPSLIQNGKLMLLPGQSFTLNLFWDLKSVDSVYLPYEMDYTFATLRRVCNYNVICSDPEEFVVEASLNVYDKLGVIAAQPVEFTFVGTKCRNCGGGGPYCPASRGC